jgi:hypothetical protein
MVDKRSINCLVAASAILQHCIARDEGAVSFQGIGQINDWCLHRPPAHIKVKEEVKVVNRDQAPLPSPARRSRSGLGARLLHISSCPY